MSQRTPTQNNALHKYLTLLAEAFNDAGISFQAVMKPAMDIPCSKENMKELWRVGQLRTLKKISTTELTTKEINMIYDVVNLFTSEKHHISVSWPDMVSKLQDEEVN